MLTSENDRLRLRFRLIAFRSAENKFIDCNFMNVKSRNPDPLSKRNEFITLAPRVVLDVTHQNESVKTGSIDIRIELKASSNIPANTSAHCLIIHDKIFDCVPLTNEVRKVL
uniref:Double jelly roll-like domain-containing protein n=1 Tax=Glossina morsitans morsitans TaxID=37546 RepID=A0A1B0G1A4_GLOMM